MSGEVPMTWHDSYAAYEAWAKAHGLPRLTQDQWAARKVELDAAPDADHAPPQWSPFAKETHEGHEHAHAPRRKRGTTPDDKIGNAQPEPQKE